MTKEAMVEIFDRMGGEVYDKNNNLLKPISDNLHFLIKLILSKLPENARILCVGVGTGADIIDLAKTHKGWSFIGIDPASSMLERCEEKLKNEKIFDRCQLFHGYLSDYQAGEKFDAILCLFVMHFIKDMSERAQMYKDMAEHLKSNGHLISAEISVDFKDKEYAGLLENWKALHRFSGASEDKLSSMGTMLEQQLAVLSSEQTEDLIFENGFKEPTSFFQSFLVRGWHAKKI